MSVGEPAPEFELPSGDGGSVRLSDFRGRLVVLYFYPKDATPGCTQEACEFRDAHPGFAELGAVVLGVSPDGEAKHRKFAAAHELPFPLLSDSGHTVAEAYGVWKEKSLYGRRFLGIERSTFLIDGDGRLRAEWRKVRVPGHARAVLEKAQQLAGGCA